MELVRTVATTALVSGLVGALVSALVASVKSQGKRAIEHTAEERASLSAMRAGLRALLWRELKNIHDEAFRTGGLSVEQRRHLESVYAAYHSLGGNGTGTRLYGDAMKMPVLE